MKLKTVAALAVVLSGVGAANLVQARSNADVQWSVTIGGPLGVPVYTQVQPRYAVPVYVYPSRIEPFYQAAPHAQNHWRYPRGGSYQQPTGWDIDGDGIPNRADRLYNPRWDRDGDGIPNRQDPYFNPPRHEPIGYGGREDRRDYRRGAGR